uniref:G protein-coupled receptor 137Ba-like n=1 Tax=Styela clava TaxID=7725 RepID=UPI001939575D|nr:G protein-coupled receptor 137Ba-like [Styela clava]
MVYLLFSSNCSVMDSENSTSPLTPAVSDQVEAGLTATYIILYSMLFIIVYVQLWLVLYYNYKRVSFQTVFLFLCVAWSGLRTTLFSFYFKDTRMANTLPLVWYYLFYCFPVCLQFFTLCLLNLYFSQVMFKAKPQYAANPRKYKNPLRFACLLMSAIFFAMNLGCAIVVYQQTAVNMIDPNEDIVSIAVTARVLVNDFLFVVGGIWLAYCIVRISKTTSANILLEAKGTTVCQAATVGFLIVFLFTSRAIYNLLAVSPLRCHNKMSSFNFDWYNVSDQADLVDVSQLSYVMFGIVLFVWELLPTSLVIFFFRVRRPEQSMIPDSMLNSQSYSSRVYFFDNPHRYDSDEESNQASVNAPLAKDIYHNGGRYGSSLQRNSIQGSQLRSYSSHGLIASSSPRRNTGSFYRDPYRYQQGQQASVYSQ